MKTLSRFFSLILVALAFFAFTAFERASAQSNSPAVPEGAPSLGGDDLRAAFQREYAYLVNLREGLKKQRQDVDRQLLSRAQGLERDVEALQVALARLSASNDEKLAQAGELEKRLRSGGGATAFESALREARVRVAEMKRREEGRLPDRKPGKASADLDGFESFLKTIHEGISIAGELGRVREKASSFLGLDGQAVQGSILHWGGIAAFGEFGGESFVLGPDGAGRLKALAKDEAGARAALLKGEAAPRMQTYVFSQLSERARMGENLNLAERAAGFLPVLYLLALALSVGWLFVAMART